MVATRHDGKIQPLIRIEMLKTIEVGGDQMH